MTGKLVEWPNICPRLIEKPRAYIKDKLRWCKSFRCLELPYEQPSKGLEIPRFNYCFLSCAVHSSLRTEDWHVPGSGLCQQSKQFHLYVQVTSPHIWKWLYSACWWGASEGTLQNSSLGQFLPLLPFWRPTTQVDITRFPLPTLLWQFVFPYSFAHSC